MWRSKIRGASRPSFGRPNLAAWIRWDSIEKHQRFSWHMDVSSNGGNQVTPNQPKLWVLPVLYQFKRVQWPHPAVLCKEKADSEGCQHQAPEYHWRWPFHLCCRLSDVIFFLGGLLWFSWQWPLCLWPDHHEYVSDSSMVRDSLIYLTFFWFSAFCHSFLVRFGTSVKETECARLNQQINGQCTKKRDTGSLTVTSISSIIGTRLNLCKWYGHKHTHTHVYTDNESWY